jgi:hypothetical protein
MSRTRSLTPAVTTALAIVVVFSFTVALGIHSSFAKKNDPETECLIDVQDPDGETLPATYSCTDGDACDGDGATNGQCQVRVRACVNVSGQSACTPASLKKAKVAPKKAGITVTPNAASSVCGAFTTQFVLKLRKNGTKASKPKVLKAKAIGTEKGVSDADKSKVTCQPCPTESCVPSTTTTTVTPTTTSTSSTTLPCGNGTVDAGETCDFNSIPDNGCAPATPLCNATCDGCTACGNGVVDGTEVCDPEAPTNGCSVGTPYCNADCTACEANCSELAFTLGDPTTYCGFPGQNDPPLAPFSGELQDGSDAKITDMGLGCLYIGGGLANVVPPGPVPDGSTTFIGVTNCAQNAVTLAPSTNPNPRTCSRGPSTIKHCANGHPGTDGEGACNADSDCAPVCVNGACVDGSPGTDGNGACTANNQCGVSSLGGAPTLVCLPDPQCFFGNPLPINNTGTSTCVLNVIDDGVTGTADRAAGTVEATIPLKSWVYLTGVDPSGDFSTGNACPICQAGTCNAGPREGQPCTTNSGLLTTLDCPPPGYLFLAPLDVVLGPLTTGTANLASDSNGIFCPGGGDVPPQPNGGAFGVATAREIIENGSAAAGGLDATDKAGTLAATFCIPPTNNVLIDNSANLPGPGAIGLGGTLRLR